MAPNSRERINMTNRRRYVRVPNRAQISYEVITSSKIETYVTKNISQGGIRFLVHNHIPKGSHLKIRLTLSAIPFSFETVVRVVWITALPSYKREAYEVGVSFIDIPPDAATHLINYIKTCANITDK